MYQAISILIIYENSYGNWRNAPSKKMELGGINGRLEEKSKVKDRDGLKAPLSLSKLQAFS